MKLMEFERKMTSVCPFKSEDHRLWVTEEHQNVEQEIARGKERNRVPTRSRHVDVLVKDLGLDNGNSVQTPATSDVTEEEESEPLASQVQVTGCQMFVPQ